ncbi:hypothetical protein, partial [Klebsiella pneumoniae]|uniref:hypothetical protein n=1 Tax=Klebsiella pneumoniae TaxID=573 RepID=UPI003B97FD26
SKIKRVERNEQVVERKVVQDGLIIAEGSKRTFTPKGKLLTSSTDRSEERRTMPFAPLDTFNGLDLRASFQRFLQANATSQPTPGLP